MSKGEEATVDLTLTGDVLFSTVVQKRNQLLKELKNVTGKCRIDFAGVGRVDSSALSLWLCCLRCAETRSVSLEVINLPQDLLSIAKVVGVEEQLH